MNLASLLGVEERPESSIDETTHPHLMVILSKLSALKIAWDCADRARSFIVVNCERSKVSALRRITDRERDERASRPL
jgi:hypothetical protein